MQGGALRTSEVGAGKPDLEINSASWWLKTVILLMLFSR